MDKQLEELIWHYGLYRYYKGQAEILNHNVMSSYHETAIQAKQTLLNYIEQIIKQQIEKDAEICFNKANEYEIPCKDISDRHGGKLVAANTCGHAILDQLTNLYIEQNYERK